jgi:hypothetical protein
MTSCEGVRPPQEMWDTVFHMPRGGVDASVLENGMENVAPDGPYMAAQNLGKHLHSSFAQLSLHEHCSLGKLSAVRATSEVPALHTLPMSPVAVAFPHVTVMPGLYAEDGWEDVEVPRGPVDPMWRDTVVAFAASRQYEGVVIECFGENEQRLSLYKDLVQQAISLCQGPRVYKTNLDMVATYCAVALCKGRAQFSVQQFLGLHRRLPLKKELLFLLEEDVFTTYSYFGEESSGSSLEVSSSLMSEELESPLRLNDQQGHTWIPDYIA